MASKNVTYVSENLIGTSNDVFRKDTGNYWEDGQHGVEIDSTEKYIKEISFETEQTFKLKAAPFFETRQEIKIPGNPKIFTSDRPWKTYLRTFLNTLPFEDFAFDLKKVLKKNRSSLGATGEPYAEVDFIYNFFVRDYEYILNMPQIHENLLPNIYVDISADATNTDPFFEALMTGFGVLSTEESSLLNLFRNPLACRCQKFYQTISNKLANTQGTNRAALKKRYSNIIFPMENIDLLKDIETYKNIFPMLSKIEFTTDSRTQFAQILKDSKLSSSLLKYISLLVRNNTPSHGWSASRYMELTEGSGPTPGRGGTIFSSPSDNKGASSTTSSNPQAITASMREFNLLKWWEGFVTGTLPFANTDEKEIFMGNQDESVLIARDIQNSFSKVLSLLIFVGKLQTLIEEHMRSYPDITNGKKCYNEVVAYRIAKFRQGALTGAPIQNIWIPNSNELDVVKYFDTQIKYDRQYTYIIYAYNFVLGSTISYNTATAKTPQAQDQGDLPILDYPGDELSGTDYNLTQKAPSNERYLVKSAPRPAVGAPSYFYNAVTTSRISTHPVDQRADTAQQNTNAGYSGMKTQNYSYKDLGLRLRVPFDNSLLPKVNMGAPATDGYSPEARLVVITRPSLKIIETPIAKRTGRVIDSPPVFPDVYFVALKGHDNKIKINFNTNVGSYLLHPIVLDQPFEQDLIDRIREGNRLPDTSRLRYTTDDPVDHFEIYRMTTLPEKYTDFSSHLHTTIDTDVDTNSPQKASAASAVDTIVPNIMYYYMFRCRDRHGNFSNPTSVFSVIMVSNDGIIFPIIKSIDLKPHSTPRRSSKPFKKMLNILPTMAQSIVDYSKTNVETAGGTTNMPVFLGGEAESLFGSSFKIRLTSKKTGKQIDFNIGFQTEHIPSAVDCVNDDQGEPLTSAVAVISSATLLP